jgi:hypothetical protein
MINFLISLFTGCSHRRTTFPLTLVRDARRLFVSGAVYSRTYVVCLDCGKEFPYNWREMRIERYSVVPQAKVAHDRLRLRISPSVDTRS